MVMGLVPRDFLIRSPWRSSAAAVFEPTSNHSPSRTSTSGLATYAASDPSHLRKDASRFHQRFSDRISAV